MAGAARELDPLAGMSLETKRAIYDRLGLELANSRGPFERLELDTWDALMEVCRDASRKNMTSIINSYGRKRYLDKCNDVDAFISDACMPVMRLVVRNGVRVASFKCLTAWMKQNHIIVSVPTVLNSVQYLPGAVEQAFPGYAAARLLHRVAPVMAV